MRLPASRVEAIATRPVQVDTLDIPKYPPFHYVVTPRLQLILNQLEDNIDPSLSVNELLKLDIKLKISDKQAWRKYSKAHSKYIKSRNKFLRKNEKTAHKKKMATGEYPVGTTLKAIITELGDSESNLLTVKEIEKILSRNLQTNERTEWRRYRSFYKKRREAADKELKDAAKRAVTNLERVTAEKKIYNLIGLTNKKLEKLIIKYDKSTHHYDKSTRPQLVFAINLHSDEELEEIVNQINKFGFIQKRRASVAIKVINRMYENRKLNKREKISLLDMDDQTLIDELALNFDAAQRANFPQMVWKLFKPKLNQDIKTSKELIDFGLRIRKIKTTSEFSRKNKNEIIGYIYLQSILLMLKNIDETNPRQYKRNIKALLKINFKGNKDLNPIQVELLAKEVKALKADKKYFTATIKEHLIDQISKGVKPRKKNNNNSERTFPVIKFKGVTYPDEFLFFPIRDNMAFSDRQIIGTVSNSEQMIIWDTRTSKGIAIHRSLLLDIDDEYYT